MTDTIKKLEQDIAQTRMRLGNTIDRLQDNLSPSDVVEHLIGPGRGPGRPDFGDILDPVVATVRSHPAPVLFMAVGVGWLVYKMVRGEAEPALRAEDHRHGVQTLQ
jgi:hypothetical protein